MKLVLVDGHAILHRAYHAYPPLTTSKGELVGAVYGFISILLTVLKKLHPEYVTVAFDLPKPTFRHKKFKGYKAHRKPTDEALLEQIPRVKQVVKALSIPIFEVPGYEADDVIGTLALQAKVPKVKSLEEIVIVTGDQDALQLVDEKIKVYMPARGRKPERIYDKKAVVKKYGLKPTQIVDLKALSGDASDGIPGVRGIGPKTAVKLLRELGSVEEIYRVLGIKPNGKRETLKKLKSTVIKESIRQKLMAGIDSAWLSRNLAIIDLNVPIKLKLSACRLTEYDKTKALDLFKELEFESLIRKLPDDDYEKMVRETMEEKKATLGTQKITESTEGGRQMGLF